MSDVTLSPGFAPAPIPVREIVPWALFGGLLILIGLYFVGAGQDMRVHEFFHDGRHLLGFPCH